MNPLRIFTDQMQRVVELPVWPPKRIISLVPSQTEFLADLGLDNEVIGITKFCIHPKRWFQEKTRVGGTKTLNLSVIQALNPDLIIGNKEENDIQQIQALQTQFPVWMSDIIRFQDALQMMHQVGEITGRPMEAQSIMEDVENAFANLPVRIPKRKAAYLIWYKPYMAAGGTTYIDQMLEIAGFENVFQHLVRYPEVTEEQILAANPEVILLSSEPFPFAEKHIDALQHLCPAAKVLLVDGELFSWYGSRMLQVPGYFKRLREQIGIT
ncbi:MAG TPA: cobalamin-binding protein [Saprospirales bacterium]|nr:cobalamin-binding protein [Saprospirales bacterium]